MARLFVPAERWGAAEVLLEGDEHHYVCRVLRMGEGDALTLFDGAGNELLCRLGRPGTRSVAAAVVGRRAAGERRLDVTLLVGLPKGDRMDLVVQKATELGVGRIAPVLCDRSVARPRGARAETRRERWLKIAREAARQCGRADAPVVDALGSFSSALSALSAEALKLLFWEGARGAGLRGLLPLEPPPRVEIAIGPEGGFTGAEVEAARAHGFLLASLGPRVLRAETASIVALSLVGYALGDLADG
jgi:16S rRNA (uracil1498-N3)-methyltransferase